MPLFAGEEPADGHQCPVVTEAPLRLLDELRAELRIRVHHEHRVVVTQVRQDLGERLVQRAALLMRVVDGLEHVGSGLARHPHGAVGAVVGHHDDALRRQRLRPQRGDGRRQRGLLVVRRDQRGDGHLPGELAARTRHHRARGERAARAVRRRTAVPAGDDALGGHHDHDHDQGDRECRREQPDLRHLGAVHHIPDATDRRAHRIPHLRRVLGRHCPPQQRGRDEHRQYDRESDDSLEEPVHVPTPPGWHVVLPGYACFL